ncbi:MAG: ATP-binding protein, partial [Candidatus Margulisiibacteriota bacterium]
KQVALEKDKYSSLLEANASHRLLQQKAITSAGLSKSRVTVIAANGSVLADSSTPFEKVKGLENHAARPEVVNAATRGIGRSSRYSNTTEKGMIYAAAALKDKNNKLLGFLRFSVPETYAAEIMSEIRRSVVAAFAVAVVLVFLLSFFFGRAFSAPIVRLSKVADKIARGEFPQTIIRKSRFEIGQLEQSIEKMSQRLSGSFQKLASEQGQLSAIIESMTEGLVAVDAEGKIILANPSAENMFAVTEPEMIGKTLREGVRNNDISSLIAEAISSRKLVSREISAYLPDERIWLAQADPIKGQKGEIVGAVCVLYDITELRKLEKYRSEFVANVSHELKTPLTAIRGYVETLLGGAIYDEPRNKEFLRKIEKHSINLSSLIDDILAVSSLESKKEVGHFVPVDISGLVGKAIETVTPRAAQKGVALKRARIDEGCVVSGIEDHVYRAILNLADNAVNYTQQGGEVEVSCAKENGVIRVSVKDTGIGIARDQLERIFERFYRVDAARSRDIGGTGLGLSIVKHIMNVHQGSVEVQSEPGKGSVFSLVFPAIRP